MKQYLNIGKEPNLHKIIIASAVLHIMFLTLASIPIRTKDREYKSYFVNLVGPSEVRSPVARPRAEKKTAKSGNDTGAVKVKPALKKRVRQKSKADISLEPEKKVSKEIERLRAIRNLSQKKKEKETSIARARKADEDIAQAIEGIRKKVQASVSRGPGVPGAQTSVDVNPYIALVQQSIWNEWILPAFDTEGYEAVLSFRIDKQGNVLSPRIVTSSGNSLFDRSAMKAILKASPLPPPPVEEEFQVRFRP